MLSRAYPTALGNEELDRNFGDVRDERTYGHPEPQTGVFYGGDPTLFGATLMP